MVRGLGLLLFVAIACSSGCGKEKPKPYPVSGQVSYRKVPLKEAVVTFHPKPGQPPGHPISATTDAEGKFQLTTTTANDGAPAGEYMVTIVLREKRRDGDEEVRNGKNLLPDKYADPEKSGITVVVKPQENVLAPIVLTD